MNSILNIKLPFNSEQNNKKSGARNLKSRNKVNTAHIDKLINDLKHIKNYYERIKRVTENILIDANYNDIVAKSNRIVELLRNQGDLNDNIVGARFSKSNNHIITYYVPMTVIDLAIKKLNEGRLLISSQLDGEANYENFDSNNPSIKYPNKQKTRIRNTIIDCSVLEGFDIPDAGFIEHPTDSLSITFYNTELTTGILLSKIINVSVMCG